MTTSEDLQRFLDAQKDSYATALDEINNGRKRTHWMWFIFPQIHGLGQSEMARKYAISNIHEAAAYLAHPVLGHRLVEISTALLSHAGVSAHAIFGSPDDLKLKSSMTLFSALPKTDPVFKKVLGQFYNGNADALTLRILSGS